VTFVYLLEIELVVMLSPFPPSLYPPLLLSAPISPVLFHRPQPLGGDSPPQPWSRGCYTYEWCAAAPTLFDFVLTVTSSMHPRNLTQILPPIQHPCIQPPSITHSHPPHGMSANFVKLCSQNIPPRATNGLTPSRSAECESTTLALYQ